MEMVKLKDWVIDRNPHGDPPYVPTDAVGRHLHFAYDSPSPIQPLVYQPEQLVENYTSLIWKEGFRTIGSFEMKTYDIENTLKRIPKGSLVSLRDTEEICVVTTHHIETNDSNEDVLTVTGVALLPYLLENRPTWAYNYDPTDHDQVRATRVNLVFQIPDHLAFVIWAGVVFPHSEGGYKYTQKPFELPMNTMMPHVAVSQTITSKGDWYRAEWPPPLETRLNTASELMSLDNRYGMRSIRPVGKDALIYTPSLTSLRGEGATTPHTKVNKILFDVYQGVDRTVGDDKVVFRHDSGDILSSEFLSSMELYKVSVVSHIDVDGDTFGTLYPKVVSSIVWQGDGKVDEDGNPTLTQEDVIKRGYILGVNFSMGEVASSAKMEHPTHFETVESRLESDGLKFLRENETLEILTAEISPHTQYKYKEHYDLGDVVLVQGKYGDIQKMIVSEYTRTSEKSEITGYPTLVRWTDPELET